MQDHQPGMYSERTATRKVNLATQRLAPAVLESELLPERAPEFLSFMKRREALRVAKAAGAPWPWSDDEVLNMYKFTNVKREHDRTTAWMREHFTPRAATSSAGTTVFNCALFRCFGTTAMGEAVGWIDGEYDAEAVVRAAQACRAAHGHAFTPACTPLPPPEGSREITHAPSHPPTLPPSHPPTLRFLTCALRCGRLPAAL